MNETRNQTDRIEQTVDIAASVEDVWRALTDADELTRWFPIRAKVAPGVGGSIHASWSEAQQWDAPIVVWKVGEQLRYLWSDEGAPDEEQFGVDFTLEPRGEGGTRLTLVHFGFGPGTKWESMYDGVRRGWDFQLFTLKHYLERHRGEERRVIYLTRLVDDASAAWRTALGGGDDALIANGSPLESQEEDAITVRLRSGEVLSGRVRRSIPGLDLQVVLDEPRGGVLRIQTDARGDGAGATFAIVLAAFNAPVARMDELESALAAWF